MDSNFSDSQQQSQFNPGPAPDNNLVWAILSTILCCWPFGIYAIIRSTKVNTLWLQGDHAGAQKAADDAKKWSIYSAVAAVIFWIIYVIFFVVLAGAAAANGGF